MTLLALNEAEGLVYREARLLDEQDFDAWLGMYSEDVLFWMPAWRDDNSQTDDPDRELSLIYYRGRRNLEDRVSRLRSGLSAASKVAPRVVHLVTNVELGDAGESETLVRSCFANHVYDPRSGRSVCFFGRYEHGFRREGGEWRISRKIIRLMNDVIPTVIDVNVA